MDTSWNTLSKHLHLQNYPESFMTNDDDGVYEVLASICLEVQPEIPWWSHVYVSTLKPIQEPLHKKEKSMKGQHRTQNADLIILFNVVVNVIFGGNNKLLLLLNFSLLLV